jgi:hypothetical protein
LKPVTPTPSGARLLLSIKRAYYETSVIQDVCTVSSYDATLNGKPDFVQSGLRVPIPKGDMEKTDRVILVDELGKAVSTGERNYLFDIWAKKAPEKRYPHEQFTPEGFQQALEELVMGLSPIVLFTPVEKYVEIASWMHRGEGVIRWRPGGASFVLEDGRELRIIWSNKYAPLDRFIMADPSASRWLFKPDPQTHDRLTVMFVENARDAKKVDFYVRTLIHVGLVNPEGVKQFRFE